MTQFDKISTHWTEMENILEENGPKALAAYITERYFEPIAGKFRTELYEKFDDLALGEFASEVIFRLIKNDYSQITRLDRNRGTLRGLFRKIIKNIIYEHRVKKTPLKLAEIDIEKQDDIVESFIDIHLDVLDSLEMLKEKRPNLYTPMVLFYVEGKKVAEIAQELEINKEAVKNRLLSGRRWLKPKLEDYDE